jgi:cytochrome oxidase Cu insertion factor (SCO1/SenC/PrrC family)
LCPLCLCGESFEIPVPVSRSPLKQIIGATILLLIAAVIFIPAYFFWNGSIQHSVTALPVCGDAPPFESSDQAGRSIGTTELAGTVWVAGFFDVTKPADAELLNSKFAELDQNLHGAKGLTLVSFCIGAEKRVLEDYAQRYEASDRWRLVPQGRDNGSALIQDWTSATAECRGDLPLPNLFVLIDRRGRIRSVYDTTAPEVVQKIFVDAGNLLRAEQPSP